MIISILALLQLALFATGMLGPWRDPPERQTNGRLPVTVRILLSLSLLVAAFIIWSAHLSTVNIYSDWVLLGMLVSFIADLIMARLIPVPNRLIGGMVVFGVAHALYLNAYIHTIQTISSLEPYSRWSTGLVAGLVFYGLVALLGWWLLIRNPQKGTALNLGALLYGLWISIMAAHALALANALGGGFWLAALGGLSFVSSDLMLGMINIRGVRFKNANDWVWLTYVAGQMGIIYTSGVI